MNTHRALWTAIVVLFCDIQWANAYVGFGAPVNLGPMVNSPTYQDYPCLSADGLSLYFDSGTDLNNTDLFVTTRTTSQDSWDPPVTLGPTVNSPQADWAPHISADGLELYFTSKRPGGDINGRDDIWVARRASLSDEWGTPVNLGSNLNTDNWDTTPCLSQDGLTLYFTSGRYNEFHGWVATDLYVSHRKSKDASWDPSVNMGPVINDYSFDYDPALSPDGLLLLFSSDRGVPSDNSDTTQSAWFDLWMTSRKTVASAWNPPVKIGSPVNSEAGDWSPSISRDGKTLSFASERAGGYGSLDIWQAPIIPIVDFNGDGKVDAKDQDLLMAHRGQDDPLCDVGPFAWGDGVVDDKDLTVLGEYISKEAADPTLLAHWALDETEGALAHESAGQNIAFVIGKPTWQPNGGIVGGALAFDGADDWIFTQPVVGLSSGSLSVLVWVKGGAPGQVVIAQHNGASWLLANPVDGTLMTKLTDATRTSAVSSSAAVITDGTWHRIGLVWDGTNRILYVDGKEVARDAQPQLVISDGSFKIGGGVGPGSFWSGLIDDVRIYNRVVRP